VWVRFPPPAPINNELQPTGQGTRGPTVPVRHHARKRRWGGKEEERDTNGRPRVLPRSIVDSHDLATADAVSVDRVRADLETSPAQRLNLDWNMLLPGATFRTSVEQRVYVLSFKEQLAKEFKLTPMQEQSQEWASRCCGVNLVRLVTGLEKRLERRRERKTREEVARELTPVQAAAAR
jgi:hypothetical protein